jgi:hypothetical protein
MSAPAANALESNQEQKGDLSYHYWANKTGEPPLPKPEPKVRRREWTVREGACASARRELGGCEAPDGLCGGRTDAEAEQRGHTGARADLVHRQAGGRVRLEHGECAWRDPWAPSPSSSCVVLWLLVRSPLKSAVRGDPQAGTTWEEKSHMEWAKGEMERRLVGLSATAMELKVVSIKGCTGDVSCIPPANNNRRRQLLCGTESTQLTERLWVSMVDADRAGDGRSQANVVITRGRPRHGFDLELKLGWTAVCGDTTVEVEPSRPSSCDAVGCTAGPAALWKLLHAEQRRGRGWHGPQGSLEFAEVSRDTVVDDELEAEVKVDTKKVKAEHQKAVSGAAKSLVPAIRKQLVSFDADFKARAEGGA